ncbi:MAG: DMT family transporter [Spirochaetota bacterium]
MLLNILLLLLGVLAASSAVIMIKACSLHPILMASYRLLIAALFLTPLYIKDVKTQKLPFSFKLFRTSIIPGLVLGLHFISWIFGAKLTTVANSTLIVNMLPVVMPFVIFFLIQETVTVIEIIGTVLAMAGVFLLSGLDFRLAGTNFSGDILCFISLLFFALYLGIGKKANKHNSLWIYLVPLYYAGGIFCFIISLFFTNPGRPVGRWDFLMVVGLGIIPTVLGHSILNYSLKRLRSQLVSLINLGQVLFAGIMGYIFFREVPGVSFYISSAFILSGVVLVIIFSRTRQRVIEK